MALASAGVVLAAAGSHSRLVAAFSNTRTISLYNIHTKETLTVEYKRNGQYVPDAMDKINWIMRDWRRNEKTTMDPKTIDILWEMHTELGSAQPIHIICGYRSRSTNEMLRKTVGGQASESQHITGKAVDVTFPDVPLKNARYAAMIREQGGVGYYPTSGVPFIHVDTGRVRAWPRMPRYELALLFPNGSTKHAPADGGEISSEDVSVARSRYKDLAVQIAAYFDMRKAAQDGRKPAVMLADAGAAKSAPPSTKPAGVQLAALTPSVEASLAPREPATAVAPVAAPDQRAVEPAARRVAKAEPKLLEEPRLLVDGPAAAKPAPRPSAEPRLVAEPRVAARPPRPAARPSEDDRRGMETLVALASAPPDLDMPKLVAPPAPAARRGLAAAAASESAASSEASKLRTVDGEILASAFTVGGRPRTSWMQLAALEPDASGGTGAAGGASVAVMSDALPPGWGNGYAAAPAFDEEHPEELHYRPFPIAPLLTATPSIDEPAIARVSAPDIAQILHVIDQPTAMPQMSFRPGLQTAETMWAQQFRGEPVVLADANAGDGAEGVPTRLIPRGVKTTSQR